MLIIAGDFNAVLLNDTPAVIYTPSQAKPNDNTKHLKGFIEEKQLIPINCRQPKNNYILNTFHGPNNRKQRLDYILVPKKWVSSFHNFTTKRPPYSSDHKILIDNGNLKLANNRKISPTSRPDWTALRQPDISNKIATQIQQTYQPTGDNNADYNAFVQISTQACSTLPTITRSQRIHPWEDQSIRVLRTTLQDRRTAYRAQPCKRTLRALKRAGKKTGGTIHHQSGAVHHKTMCAN